MRIRFVNVVFLQGRAIIAPGQAATVDSHAVGIKGKCQAVEVQGHASDDERATDALAAARAAAVRGALIARGVPAEQLKLRSLGAAQPLCREATEACRARNRRVELILLDLRICK